MCIYEQNFKRLLRLLPVLQTAPGELLQQCDLENSLRVEVLESHKYTTVIKLSQRLAKVASIPEPLMTVRVYHDAKVAEVLSYQQHSRFRPKYDYPNPQMHQVREKKRVNEFFGEWLDYYFHQGRPISALVVPP